jgi:hypothetical protein
MTTGTTSGITYKQVTDLEGRFSELYTRMDEDKDRYFLKGYQLLDANKKPLKRVINVTLNDPATFAHYVIGALLSAQEQITVASTAMKDAETSYIEEFLGDLHKEIDAFLMRQGITNNKWYECEQVCMRGRNIRRILTRFDKANLFVPDCRDVDGRFFAYEMGINGIKYCSAQFPRTKSSIFDEYKLVIKAETAIVRDVWDDKKEYIWVDEKFAKSQPNPYGYVPFVITIAPTGSSFNDTDAFAKNGESIYAMVRDIFDEENRTASILQTQNMLTIRPPRQYASERGERGKLPDEDISGIGAEVAVEKGGGYALIPQGDAKIATQFIMNILAQARQRGSLANVDYGSINQTMSAVAIKTLMMHTDLITYPRTTARIMFNQECDKMMIKQILMWNKDVELGEEGMKRVYDVGKLAGSYSIKYEYVNKDPVGEIANWSVAQVAGQFLSTETILRDIIKRPNPSSDMDLKRKEKAEKLDPTVMMLETVKSLVNMGEDVAAEMVLRILEETLRQRSQPMGTPAPVGATQNTPAPLTQGNPQEAIPPAAKTIVPLMNNNNGQVGANLPVGV